MFISVRKFRRPHILASAGGLSAQVCGAKVEGRGYNQLCFSDQVMVLSWYAG